MNIYNKNKRIIGCFVIIICILVSIFRYANKHELMETFNEYKSNDSKEFVYPLGNIVGLKADTEGVLVLGFEEEDIEYIGGLKIGDTIISIENKKINNYMDIGHVLNKTCLKEVRVVYKRNDEMGETTLKTKYENDKYKLGVWVRDKISGIGTLTCYNPSNKEFYAIGHGIYDMDTDKLLSIKEGNIYEANNIKILKYNKDQIGQIRGVIDYNNPIGEFETNTNNGIKGEFSRYMNKINLPMVEVAKKEEIKTGDAYILFQSQEGNIKSYKIKIEKIIKEENNMLISVVDDELIDYTGGIVKGMSGAPIIQNNKLIGSLTYVFKHNPKKGYGIFIDEMLKL